MATDPNAAKDPPARRTMMGPTSSMGGRARLECARGPEKGQTFRVAPGTTLIGRDPSCDLGLSETAISRQHCQIERRGDTWILKNLSSNGTIVNRKPVEEVVLADGDEIRLGAKTRLVFVIENLAGPTTGRPQFRRRGTEAEEAEAEPAEEVPEEKPSLFKRRKGLFIALGAYLFVILVIAMVLAFKPEARGPTDELPILGLEDQIRPAPGVKPMRIVRESPEGMMVEDDAGQLRVIPLQDLRSGKAKVVPGIRKAIEVRYLEQDRAPPNYPYTIEKRNPALGDRYKKEAIDKFVVSDLPGKEGYLLGAVRLFQTALAYYGDASVFLGDPNAEGMRQQAIDRLIKKVQTLYDQAILFERAGDYKQAWNTYEEIHKYMPEKGNPVFENVSRRMTVVKEQYRKQQDQNK